MQDLTKLRGRPIDDGLELFFQPAPLEPTAPAGFAASNGVAVRLGN